jgi:hypothetical protein
MVAAMTKLDRLIEELCPDGVEIVKLDDVIISLNTADAKNFYVTVREIVERKILSVGNIVIFNENIMVRIL